MPGLDRKRDISKSVAFVLVILTVLISAVSTWMIIDTTLKSPEVGDGFGSGLIRLMILRGPVVEPVDSDTNAGHIRLNIADKGG